MARRSVKKNSAEPTEGLETRPDLDSAAFLKAAAPVLRTLKQDLLTRAKASPAVTSALEARHEAEKKAERPRMGSRSG